jgi:hypothetical protein
MWQEALKRNDIVDPSTCDVSTVTKTAVEGYDMFDLKSALMKGFPHDFH